MPYTYDYARPGLTADCVIFGLADGSPLHVLLIERAKYPFEGSWAVPGGFVEEGEDPLEAAQRELEEETGLAHLPMNQYHTFGKPGRDPRGWVVAVAHWTVVRVDQVHPRAGDDAAKTKWFPLNALPPLAFDHAEILEKAVTALRQAILADTPPSMLHESVVPTQLQSALDEAR